MKKIIALLLSVVVMNVNVYARVGDMGFFGGISEGRRLPKTTEELLYIESKNDEFPYKEIIFLSGEPIEFTGLIKVGTESDSTSDDAGSYSEAFKISNSSATDPDAKISRDITFDVNYRKVDNQTIKDYKVNKWKEEITIAGTKYNLDDDLSHFNMSILEIKAPGVTYYRGDISKKAVYSTGEDMVTESVSGSFHGYGSPYSATETHRLDGVVNNNDLWQMQYQIRPSVTVEKVLSYEKNEPQLINFLGNYREVIQNRSGLQYNIYTKPLEFYNTPNFGGATIESHKVFEQLIAPSMEQLRGHFAEYDVKKLFSMEILEGDTKFYVPNQAITRAQYVTMMAKAIKVPTDKYINKEKSKGALINDVVFSDIHPDRPDYPYIMGAYDSRLAIGTGNGYYSPDVQITREEAITILIRALDLSRLGLDPTPVTPFVDDNKIADWAKSSVYASQRIGLITGDQNGNFNPKSYITKAEAAVIVNRLIDYMREDMQVDYSENIVHFPN